MELKWRKVKVKIVEDPFNKLGFPSMRTELTIKFPRRINVRCDLVWIVKADIYSIVKFPNGLFALYGRLYSDAAGIIPHVFQLHSFSGVYSPKRHTGHLKIDYAARGTDSTLMMLDPTLSKSRISAIAQKIFLDL